MSAGVTTSGHHPQQLHQPPAPRVVRRSLPLGGDRRADLARARHPLRPGRVRAPPWLAAGGRAGSNFTASFDAVFQATGPAIVRTAAQAARMNAICERLIGTLRRELLDRTLILNQSHLRAVLADYREHYNAARTYQGPGQRVPGADPGPRATAADAATVQIRRRSVVSGLINQYERAA
jgi:hypothetical protein